MAWVGLAAVLLSLLGTACGRLSFEEVSLNAEGAGGLDGGPSLGVEGQPLPTSGSAAPVQDTTADDGTDPSAMPAPPDDAGAPSPTSEPLPASAPNDAGTHVSSPDNPAFPTAPDAGSPGSGPLAADSGAPTDSGSPFMADAATSPAPDAALPLEPDLRVFINDTELPCGGTVTMAATDVVGQSTAALHLDNFGTAALTLQDPSLTLTTADPSEFFIQQAPESSIAPGQSTALQLGFSPRLTGQRSATLSILSDDPQAANCTLSLSAAATATGGADNSTWSSTSSFDTGRFNFALTVNQDRIYVLGGCSRQLLGRTAHDSVEFAAVGTDGNVGSWSFTTDMPLALCDHAAFAYGEYVYIAGGIDADDVKSGSVYSAQVTSSGALAAWSNAPPLPEATRGASAIVHGNTVYLVGGREDSGAANQVRFSRIGSDGTLEPWQMTQPLLRNRLDFGIAVVNQRLYVFGGWDSGVVLESEFAPILPGGSLGPWTQATPIPAGRSSGMGFSYGDHIYLLAGDDGNDELSDGIFAQVQGDGSLGTWSTLSFDFATARSGAAAFVHHNRVYVLGGWNKALQNYRDVQFASLL